MKQTVYFNDFHKAFVGMDRGSQFSYEALELLYDYLLELEQDTGWEIELDVIAICCDYSEMTAEEVVTAYNLDPAEDVAEFLNMSTSLVGVTPNNTYVFQQF